MTGPRGPYSGTAQRREEILQAAWEVFAVQGYRGGSLRDIAGRLGFSTAGITHHFGNKDGLLLAVLQFRETFTKPSDIAGLGLLDHLRAVVVRNSATRGAVQLYVTMSAEATDPAHPAHQHFVDRYTQIVDLYAAAFAQAQAVGDLVDDLDPRAAARELVAFLDGLQLQWLLTPTFDMVDAYDAYVATFRAAFQTGPSQVSAETSSVPVQPI